MKETKNQGITLIALVVTIIVLLILAGVSIAVLTGDNSILKNSQEAKLSTKLAEIEEQANIIYTGELIGALSKATGDRNVELAEVCDELKKPENGGYNVDYKTLGAAEVDKVIFASENVTTTNQEGTEGTISIAKGGSEVIEVTVVPKEGTGNWYVEVSGKNYKIYIPEGKKQIKVERTETNVSGGDLPNATFTSDDTTGKVTVTGENNKGTITVDAETTITTAHITATAGGKSAICTVTVVTPVTVTFNVNNGAFVGTEMGTRTGIPGEAIALPTAPTVTGGNVFKGWYTAANGGDVVYAKNATSPTFPAEDTTVYAHYGPDVATVEEVGDGTSTVWYKGSGNWEVFFKDNGRTYLIYKGANEYESENAPILGTKNWSAIYNNPGNYYATGTLSTPAHLTGYLVDSNYTERFKPATQAGWLNKYMMWLGDGTTNYSDAGNMAFTLFMLDQNVWKYGTLTPGASPTAGDYYDETYADWVIGGPTMEMMVATANTLYPSQTNSCSVTQANGYSKTGLGSSSLPAGSVLNHTSGSSYHYYWLASPSYSDVPHAWLFYGDNASVSIGTRSDDRGFRPVVCLKSNVSLTKTGATTTTYVLTTQQ